MTWGPEGERGGNANTEFPPKPPPQAVLFDLFGTLVDEASERDALDAAMAQLRDRFEIPEPATELAGEFAVILMDRVAEERLLPRDAPIGPYELAVREALDDLLAPRHRIASHADRSWFWATLLTEFRGTVRTFPDALPCVAETAALVPHVGVLTDSDAGIAGLILEATGLRPHVAALTTAEEAGAFKPDPAPFRAALAKAGVEPRDAVMVGDSFERDVEPAFALGMTAVLLDRYDARTVATPYKVRSLAELAPILRKSLESS